MSKNILSFMATLGLAVSLFAGGVAVASATPMGLLPQTSTVGAPLINVYYCGYPYYGYSNYYGYRYRSYGRYGFRGRR